MRRTHYAGCAVFFLISIFLSESAHSQEESVATIEKQHTSFYRTGSEIDIDSILGLDDYEDGQVLSVTVQYNMAVSALDAQCLANGSVIEEFSLPRGLGKSLTCDFGVPASANLALRLLGDRGQIQVIDLEARVIIAESGLKSAQLISEAPVSAAAGQKKLGTAVTLERKERELRRAPHFEIVSPSGKDNWELGKAASLYWTSTGIAGDVAIELFRDRDRVAILTRKAPIREGTLKWTVSGADIVPGKGYRVRMTSLADKKSHVSEAFTILEDYKPSTLMKYTPKLRTLELKQQEVAQPVSLRVLSPKYQDEWHVLRDYAIKWESQGLARDDEIGIAIKSSATKMAKIIDIVENTGEYTYHVPYPLVVTGFDMQVILTPLKDRSVEVLSDPFVIHKPAVDLIANTPTITYKQPKKRPKKWWQVLGDIFTGGITWYVKEVVDIGLLMKEGTTMQVDVKVINKGSLTRRDVPVECSIHTLWGNVLYSFEPQTIPAVYEDSVSPLQFSARTKGMGLDPGRYNLEILIDPDNETREEEPFRANNRVLAEFEVE